ncbi:hypothetical protein B9T33_14325 [Acinetobacter sp. ANC 5054]|uniref:hypothetical protein n=1 Tax=Acinetobacter sp. ANC 5054 TaxID=1977877 RepID=UPI000A348520|nr:hypothetical protein [Acinetobacter sp. ANC 5054]OTG78487.1 hypothetical protein B9T33_14325 [Acinetobacter sp. ANC 5054]
MSWIKFTAVTTGGLIVLCLMVLFFKPETGFLKTAVETSKTSPNHAITAAQESASQPMQNPQQNLKPLDNQTELLRQRDQLYTEFAAISQGLSHGQKPDIPKVEGLLQKQMQLVSTGILSAQDALNYCQFLRKIMPEMQSHLDGYIDQLKKM